MYFLIYLAGEIFLSALFANIFGFGLLLLEMGITGLIGLVALSGSREALKHSLVKLIRNEISKEDFVSKNLKLTLGSFLLLMPGVLSDIIGVYLIARGYSQKSSNDEIIDVEIIEDHKNDERNEKN